MIVYDNFWRTLKASRESTYTLIKKHNISSSTIDKLRKNKPITKMCIRDSGYAEPYFFKFGNR